MNASHIAIAMTVILGAIAALHAYWAAGGLWPGRTERKLIDTVIGDPRLTRMPPAWMSAAVAALLAGFALLPLLIVPLLAPFPISLQTNRQAMAVAFFAAMVFLGRGIAGYLPVWRRLHPAEPFATYDLLLYSPLCILLGVAFIFIDFVVLVAV